MCRETAQAPKRIFQKLCPADGRQVAMLRLLSPQEKSPFSCLISALFQQQVIRKARGATASETTLIEPTQASSGDNTNMIIRFLKAFGQIFFLMIFWMTIGMIFPKVGIVVGLILLSVTFFALFKPLPQLRLVHRGYTASMMFFVGLLTTLVSYGTQVEATKLAELKESDPAGYLAKLEDTDREQWLEELETLDPARYEVEAAKIAKVEAEKNAEKEAAEAKRKAEIEAAEAAERDQRVREQQARTAEAIEKRNRGLEDQATNYEKRIDREIASIPGIKASGYTQDVAGINTAIVVMGAWALLYEEGQGLPLSEEAEAKRQQFRKMVIDKQVQLLPALRDAYGPAMRKELWIADGSARTVGQGYRTVEFVSVAFARNANIQQIHTDIRENLMMLRFTRAQYKWFEQADEYSYYTIEPPKDSDLVKWESGGSFRVLK